ncbi:MAG: WhiB family transcriptional regulator [Angustibacter sp.]
MVNHPAPRLRHPAPRLRHLATATATPTTTTRTAATGVPCRDHGGQLWFADEPADLELAKELCAACPLRTGCLEGAIERREPWGVWGGELFARGVVVARKRPRGRPRKDAQAA